MIICICPLRVDNLQMPCPPNCPRRRTQPLKTSCFRCPAGPYCAFSAVSRRRSHTWKRLLRKLTQEIKPTCHAVSPFCGDFESLHAWANLLDAAMRRGRIKFNRLCQIDLGEDRDIGGVE